VGDGRPFPAPGVETSLKNPERYGENVKREAIRYATAHLRTFFHKTGIVGTCKGGNQWRDGDVGTEAAEEPSEEV
jgi:hypothetical protein